MFHPTFTGKLRYLGFLNLNNGLDKTKRYQESMVSRENLNQNKCSTLWVEHGRNGSASAA